MGKRGPQPKPVAERFWDKVSKSADGCWLWTGSKNGTGYGYAGESIGNSRMRSVRAHRAVWEMTHGPIPDGLHVLHKCDVRNCVNPDHLFLGTHQDNMADLRSKGRASRPRGAASHRAKLTAEQAAEIRSSKETRVVLSARFGISKMQVTRIKRGDCWKDDTSLPLPQSASP